MLAAQNQIDGCYTFETYAEAWVCFYMYPHLGGLLGLGSMVSPQQHRTEVSTG